VQGEAGIGEVKRHYQSCTPQLITVQAAAHLPHANRQEPGCFCVPVIKVGFELHSPDSAHCDLQHDAVRQAGSRAV
jgi:hypothetical protein